MLLIDSFTFHIVFLLAALNVPILATLGVLLLGSRRIGGLTFCTLGRFGLSFYFRKG